MQINFYLNCWNAGLKWRVCFLKGTGLTLEGALPSDQDCQPKPAKRARTSFTAEQLQVGSSPTFSWPADSHGLTCACTCAGDAVSVCPGQQPWCSDAAETGRDDGAEQTSHTGGKRLCTFAYIFKTLIWALWLASVLLFQWCLKT